MRLHKQLLTNNNCYKDGKKLVVKGVMWHSTGANNPNLKRYVQPDDGILGTNNYKNHWNRSLPDGQQKCVHAFIGLDKNGAVATYQTLPWDMRGWHAGGKGNDSYIGFEICEDKLESIDYFNAIYKEACELTAYLCKMFKLDPLKDGVVICHSEGYARGVASNHADVMHWFKKFNKTMDDARKDIKALMDDSAAATKSDTLYRVQCGAFSKLEGAKSLIDKLENDGYATYLVEVDGYYKVQCGAFASKARAEALAAELEKDGYGTYITTRSGAAVKFDAPIKRGDKVKIKKGAKSYDGVKMSRYIYTKTYTVDQLKGDRALLDATGLCTAFNIKDLTRV